MPDKTSATNRLPDPIPEPLRATETGTYTHYSVVTRLPDIGQDILIDNTFDQASNDTLEALIGEIPEGKIRPLNDKAAPDSADWAAYIAPYQDQNWLTVPWFFAETYFYRRVLEASCYFVGGHPQFGLDPFARKKKEGLAFGRNKIKDLLEWIDEQFAVERIGPEVGLQRLLLVALWGNQADLSLWPAGRGTQPQHDNKEQEQAHILADDSSTVVEYLMNRRGGRVDIVLDNAGFELISDLCLTDFFLFSGVADSVHLHLKTHPTFVSDATVEDLIQTIAWLLADSSPYLFDLGRRMQAYMEKGSLTLSAHPFWTSPQPMWALPGDLTEQFSQSGLIITKGDANYRRLLGDRHWPFTTPFKKIVSYVPTPFLALRTIKSEVAAGLTARQIEEVQEQDPDWLINGRWGLIQTTI